MWERFIIENGGTVPSTAKRHELRVVTTSEASGKQRGDNRGGKKGRVYVLAAECIGHNKGHAHRTAIHAYLATRGIHLTLKRLSAYLSESPVFESDREKGWSVKEFAAA
jgi:hypothetical protein